MKNVIVAIMMCISLVFGFTMSHAGKDEKTTHFKLDGFDNITISNYTNVNKKFKLVLENTLEPKEMVYKNNIIMFMIDDKPYSTYFDLHIKLSNNGVHQIAILFLSKSLLIEISESETTAVKMGGSKNFIIDSSSKDIIRNIIKTS